MILNIALSFIADYMGPLFRFIWGISDYLYNDESKYAGLQAVTVLN